MSWCNLIGEFTSYLIVWLQWLRRRCNRGIIHMLECYYDDNGKKSAVICFLGRAIIVCDYVIPTLLTNSSLEICLTCLNTILWYVAVLMQIPSCTKLTILASRSKLRDPGNSSCNRISRYFLLYGKSTGVVGVVFDVQHHQIQFGCAAYYIADSRPIAKLLAKYGEHAVNYLQALLPPRNLAEHAWGLNAPAFSHLYSSRYKHHMIKLEVE